MATRDDFAPKRSWASATEPVADSSVTGRLSIRIHDIDQAGRIKPLRAVTNAEVEDPRLVRDDQLNRDQIVFDDVQLTAYSTQDSERLQLVQNHADDGKPWLFGREVRMYNMACSIFVSDNDRAPGEFWNPRGIDHWRTIYEACRVSTLARQRRIVNIVFDVMSLWGGMLNSDPRLNAESPHHLQVTFGFLVLYRDIVPDDKTSSFTTISNTAQPLYLSRESAQRLTDEDLDLISSAAAPLVQPSPFDGLVVAQPKAIVPKRYFTVVRR